MDLISGIILKAQSGFFTVRSERGDFVCQLRGRLKKEKAAADLAAIGDRVRLAPQPDGTGMIEVIEPRRTALVRRPPRGSKRSDVRWETAQVLIANPDQAVFVFACAEPAPHVRMLDRFLILAEVIQVPALICANKADLVTPGIAQGIFDLYHRIGYHVIYTSAATGQGVAELRDRLRGNLSILAGPSGVGKSSLLNVVQPGLGIQTRSVSQATTKGRHMTVHPELIALDIGGYVADTPGIRALALWDVQPEELDGYFVDIRPLVSQCEFNDCSHTHEPGCAVRKAVDNGRIARSRYDSYTRLRAGED